MRRGPAPRAITNLVANAYQAMEAGGTLTSTRRVKADPYAPTRTRERNDPGSRDHARLRFDLPAGTGGHWIGLPIAVRIIATTNAVSETRLDPWIAPRYNNLPLRQANRLTDDDKTPRSSSR